jgi:HTH-type transcriptional regulator/antitoxin HigA
MAKTERNAFRPNYAVPPGETLKETIESMGMTQAELAQRTGRPKKTINEIIKGKTAIIPDTAIPFSAANSLKKRFKFREKNP